MAVDRPTVNLHTGEILLPEGPDIIITTENLVGLGDHAIYTTLPRRFTELGYNVYLDKDNRGRNDEMMGALWTRNPYIKGLSDKKPNAGYMRQGLFYETANRYPIGAIEAMERAHGLPPPYSIAPYINYDPKPFHFDVREAILVDFSAVSSRIADQGLSEAVRVLQGRFRNAAMLQLVPPKHTALHGARIQLPSVQIESIYQYLDALGSCRAFVGSEAGGQSLAAAVRGEHDVYDLDARPEVVSIMTVQTFNDRGYTYRGVDYRTTVFGQDTEHDYHFPHELLTHVYSQRCAMSFAQMRALA